MTIEVREFGPAQAIDWLIQPAADDHKYSRGVLGVRTGSAQYPGAAVLGVESAWRTGVGMVRYLPSDDEVPRHGLSAADHVLLRRPETVTVAGPIDALLAGSGIDPTTQPFRDRETIAHALSITQPTVLDAGALSVLTDNIHPVAPTVITPHRGEFSSLWHARKLDRVSWIDNPSENPSRMSRTRTAIALAQHLGVTILLKGSTTIVVSPRSDVAVVGPATPWLATAGTGDVLAGILGALLAVHAQEIVARPEVLLPISATAAVVHDAAARIASGDQHGLDTAEGARRRLGHSIVALDVAEAIPRAIQKIHELGHEPKNSGQYL